MPHQPAFNNGPSQPHYPSAFNSHNPGGFNGPRPGMGAGPGAGPGPGPGLGSGHGQGFGPSHGMGPGPGPGFGVSGPAPGGMGGSPRPGFSPAPNHSNMMMPQPPARQEWPVSGRPPNNGYPPQHGPLGQGPGPRPGPGPGPGHGMGPPHGQSSGFMPRPFGSPAMPPPPMPAFNNQPAMPSFNNQPGFNGSMAGRPSYSPNMRPAPTPNLPPAQMPPISAPPPPKFAEGPPAHPNIRPPHPVTPSNPLVNPMTALPATSYQPKTKYQAAPAPSPQKDHAKPPGMPSPNPSWQSASSTSTQNNSGYQTSHSQHRPSMHPSESYDADDRPTELIPLDEEYQPLAKAHTTALLQSPSTVPSIPGSTAVSPSPSFTAVSYLPSSPSFSEADNRPTEMPESETVRKSESFKPEPYKPAEQLSPAQPQNKTPLTPLPSSGVKFQGNNSTFTPSSSSFTPPTPASFAPTSSFTPATSFAPSTTFVPSTSFVPSTTYRPTKKDTPKFPSTPQPSHTPGFDPTVKVEISDLKPPSSAPYGDSSNIKVAIDDISPTPARKPLPTADALDSPISLDGLMESIEAMTKPSSTLSTSTNSAKSSTLQQGSSADHFKPLPSIGAEADDHKRYSLSDGPTNAPGSSQSPPVSRLVPKRPVSNYTPQPAVDHNTQQHINNNTTATAPVMVPALASSGQFQATPFTSPPPALSQPFFPSPTPPRREEVQQIAFQPSLPQKNQLHQNNHSNPNSHNNQTNQHNQHHIQDMAILNQPEFAQNPIMSIAALSDRPVQKAPSMIRRGKTLRRAAGMTGVAHPPDISSSAPAPPAKVTPDELYPYLLRLVLLAQADEVPPPSQPLPVTSKDAYKDLIKVLKPRLKDIHAGRDMAYQDPVVKKALTAMEPKFKTATNAEDLVLGFSIEMTRIQQTMNVPTTSRDAQMAIMAGLLRDVIQKDPFTGHEAVMQRLDSLVKTVTVKPNNTAAQADGLTKVIKELFRMPETVRHSKMNDLRKSSTKQNAIEDLKKCASNLALDLFPYPGIGDYHHKDHHEEFKNRERSALSGNIRALSADHHASLDMPSRQFHPSEFVFVPQSPKAFYHLLLEMCVDHALATRHQDDLAVNLISPPTKALLKECGVRWRLTSSWREIILMEVIKERYREAKVSVGFLLDFLQTKFYKDTDVHQWHISEVNMLGDVYGGLNHMIFDNVNHDIKDLGNVSADYFRPMLEILDRVHQQDVYQRLNIELKPFFDDITDTVLTESFQKYREKDEEIQKEPYENETVPLSQMALYIVSEHAVMKKRFPKPLFGAVDVAGIVVEHNLRNFVPLMQNMANMDGRKLPTGDVFPLYQLCRELVSLFEEYAPSSSVHFNISTWFRPYVLKYLEDLDSSILGWVTAAIQQDKFEEVSVGAGHSSSASDLFAFFYDPLRWIRGLNWSNDYQRATFMSKLAKVFCKAVDLYAQYMESMFLEFMPSSVSAVTSKEAKSFSEQFASFTFRSESAEAKKASRFVFTPKMCVLMNNIEAVRQRLDELYRDMDVDEIVQILRDNEPAPEQTEEEPHQFEVVIVSAERLLPMDTNEKSDPYVVLSHDDKELFRTTTIYANINPRWNEVYETTLTKEITYLVCVYDAEKTQSNRLCGWQYLCVDPQEYEDYMPHDVWLDLAQIGRLLLRITMKGERDDVQFFFGKTFRSLKRKEADLSGMIVDAMIPSVQACLTEKVLFSNFRSKASLLGFFNSSVSSAKVTKVSDEDCDNALGQLLDYLEDSLPVLYDYLTTEGMTMVITRLWREMLITIETLLVPPLSTDISTRTPLTEIEMHVAFKIVEFIKLYLNGGDAGDGFPLKVLEIPKYKDLLTVRPIYDSSSEELMEEYNRSLSVPGRGRLNRQQSDFERRPAGAAAKRPGPGSMTPNPETVLRILRMRQGTAVEEFLTNAVETQSLARQARAKAKREQVLYQRQLMKDQEY
ncbi:hypothetical protein BGZ96_005855 [Linnemannia gamsii]|uniref:C2 domain-containing protein n=1 Tax=Linnemannia gamsii TaxID=64522 RepID=A0ABQ7KF65_9FUNG|nr:hypothetical protein BGZ96_005855 [Linnemannia gamsii]